MQISDKELTEFAEIYKQEFGEEISLGEARDIIRRVLVMVNLISRPLPEELQKGVDDAE